jgi:GGDEF domain-containing protein
MRLNPIMPEPSPPWSRTALLSAFPGPALILSPAFIVLDRNVAGAALAAGIEGGLWPDLLNLMGQVLKDGVAAHHHCDLSLQGHVATYSLFFVPLGTVRQRELLLLARDATEERLLWQGLLSTHQSLRGQLERTARIDDMTGLPNRAALIDEISRHLRQEDRSPRGGALLALRFKDGLYAQKALMGEEWTAACQTVADRLCGNCRAGDMVARLDEVGFALWLPGMGPDHIAAKVDALLALGKEICGQFLRAGDTLEFRISFRTLAPGQTNRTAEDVVGQAEAALLASHLT